MEGHFGLASAIKQGLPDCINGKLCIDLAAVYAGNYTAVIQIYDRAVTSLAPISQKEIGKVNTP